LGELDIDGLVGTDSPTLDISDANSTLILDGPIRDDFDGTTLIGENSALHVTRQWAQGLAGVMHFDGGGGTASLTGSPFTSRGQVFVDSGTAAFDNDLYEIATTSTVTVANGAELAFANSPVQQGAIQLNGGTLSGAPLTNDGFISGFGTISNSLFFNSGTLTISGATLDIDSVAAFFASGSTTTLNANLELHGDALVESSATFTGSADLVVSATGRLRTTGDVTFDHDMISHGTVAPGSSPALININGDFTQSATGVLEIEVAGTALAEFDRLGVGGFAQLGGTLSAVLIDGFVPQIGDTFEILTAPFVVGAFANENLPVFSGRTFDVVYNSQSVVLQVVETACAATNGENLTLKDDTVTGIELFEVCDTITVGPNYQVAGPNGDLTLRAGNKVVLGEGASVGVDGRLRVENDPALVP